MKAIHPKGLYILLFTEMWVRFSTCGVNALLIYYMTKHLLFTQGYASKVYGLFICLKPCSMFLGGIIADRYLGQRRSVIMGIILLVIGNFLLASGSVFFLSLLIIILGSGLFSSNLLAQVGIFYKPSDSKRDSAIRMHYFAISLGGFFAPLICGTLGELYGWHYGFIAAGIGMLLGLTIYLVGTKHLPSDLISIEKISSYEKAATDKRNILIILSIAIFTILFVATYDQQGNTIALWADTYTERHILGWEMPASWIQSLNPIMVMFLIPIITHFWKWQASHHKEPSDITKIAIGCIISSISFIIMSVAALSFGKINILWVVIFTLIITLGELYVFPIWFSLVTKLAPRHMVSTFVGFWLLSFSAGNYLSGYLGSFWEKLPKDIFFIIMSLLTLISGFGVLIVKGIVEKSSKNMHGSNQTNATIN